MAITFNVAFGGDVTPDVWEKPVLSLPVSFDSGESFEDLITNKTDWTLTFSGEQMMMGDTIRIYDDGTQVAFATTTDFSHVFSSLSWPEGTHTVTATYERFGDVSTISDPLVVEVITTPPVISSPSAAKTGPITASGAVTTNVGHGTLFWIIDDDITACTAEQIIGGNNGLGFTAARSGSQAVVGTGVQNVAADRITYNTTFRMQFAHRDVAGNVSNAVSSSSFTTDALTTPLVWASGAAWVGSVTTGTFPELRIPLTAPSGSLLIVAALGSGPQITDVSFDLASPDAYAIGTASTADYGKVAYKYYSGLGETSVRMAFSTSTYTCYNWVIIIGSNEHNDADGTFVPPAGTFTFPASTFSTGALGLYFAGSLFHSPDTPPTDWTNATGITGAGGTQVSLGCGWAVAPGTSVSCTMANSTIFAWSTTWKLVP